MKKFIIVLFLLVLFTAMWLPATPSASAAGPQWVVVNWGDTLYSIAVRYGTTVGALMSANNLPNANFVYAGQRLILPSSGYSGPPMAPVASPAVAATGAYYTVRAGDTLFSIATRFGTSAYALAQANGIWNFDYVYTGQQLRIPGATTAAVSSQPKSVKPLTGAASSATSPVTDPKLAPAGAANPGKWIDVNLRTQTITAYEGSTPIKSLLVSTGTPIHPTVVGRFHIYAKYAAYTMSGGTRGVDYYYLPNVPWTMFFYQGYAIHGTYWHHNFGHRMSHGCVNLPTADAKWFYDWAPIGTLVVTHN